MEPLKAHGVNVFGLARMTQLPVLPGMRAARRGRIINISSVGGKFYEPLVLRRILPDRLFDAAVTGVLKRLAR